MHSKAHFLLHTQENIFCFRTRLSLGTALRDTDTGLGIHSTSSGFLNKIMAGDAQ